jgi:enoyl-CoA hydratase/carnithine racemase
MGNFISFEQRGGVAILTLNRPETMNALSSHEDCADIVNAIARTEENPDISVAIFTGSGRAFSAGGDIKAMKERNGIGPRAKPDQTRGNYRRGIQKVIRAIYDCELPLIAAFNGHAIGLGLDLGCLCDIRIASEQAKFAASFIKIGVVPGDGGAWALSHAVGYSKAAELFFTGETFGAAEALAMGLVSRVTSPDDLREASLDLAGRIAGNPARALRLTKRLMRESQNHRLTDVLELSSAFQGLAHETADHAEAVDAFLEKRPPVFTGG